MSRRRAAKKRPITPDLKFSDEVVTRLINCLMIQGKTPKSRGIVYKAFDIISNESQRSPVEVFKEALENVRPLVEVRSRRVGGATYPVPMDIRLVRSESLGLRWIVKSVRKRICRRAIDSLAKVILDSAKGVGDAMDERKKVHAMAEANKAFIHYRW
jgi:small subunit ribosomal protein S7